MGKHETAKAEYRWLKKYFGITLRDANEVTTEFLQWKSDSEAL